MSKEKKAWKVTTPDTSDLECVLNRLSRDGWLLYGLYNINPYTVKIVSYKRSETIVATKAD